MEIKKATDQSGLVEYNHPDYTGKEGKSKMSMNLYQIQDLEKEIESLVDKESGEISEEAFEALIVAQTQALDKLERVCQLITGLEAFQVAASNEIERIAAQKKLAVKRADQIRKYITPYVVSKGKVQAGTFTLSSRTSKAVVITDEGVIPAKYFVEKTVVTESLDKTAVKAAVDAGEVVPGAMLEVRQNLQIK